MSNDSNNNKIESILYKNNILQPVKGFIATVEEGSVSAGAKKINLTQVTVTKQIQALERELGFPLFDRTNRTNLKLTEVGKRFYNFATSRLKIVESMFEDFVETENSSESNTLRIASNFDILSDNLIKHIDKLLNLDEFKDTDIELFDISKEEGLNMLKDGKVDFAIYPVKNNEKNNYIGLDFEKYKIIKYVLIVSKNHPLANKKDITKDDISKYPYLFLDSYMYYDPRESFNNMIPAKVKCKNANWEILSTLVKHNLGMLFVFKDYYNNFLVHDKNIVVLDISDLMLKASLVIFTRKSGILKKQAKFIIEELMKDKEE